MRGEEFGTHVDFHGIQCAVGTYIAVSLYEKIKSITPDREKALKSVEKFDFSEWSVKLKEFLGKGADAMIALEAKERKYDKEKPISHWLTYGCRVKGHPLTMKFIETVFTDISIHGEKYVLNKKYMKETYRSVCMPSDK